MIISVLMDRMVVVRKKLWDTINESLHLGFVVCSGTIRKNGDLIFPSQAQYVKGFPDWENPSGKQDHSKFDGNNTWRNSFEMCHNRQVVCKLDSDKIMTHLPP